MQAYKSERYYRVRPIPTFPHETYARSDALTQREISKTNSYLSKRAQQPPEVQKTQKRDALLRRMRKAASAGRVRFFAPIHILIFSYLASGCGRCGDTDYTYCKKGRRAGSNRRGMYIGWLKYWTVLCAGVRSVDSSAYAMLGAPRVAAFGAEPGRTLTIGTPSGYRTDVGPAGPGTPSAGAEASRP